MRNIGFIGLGNMGHPMASNLVKADYNVKVFDLNETAVKQMVSEGATAAQSIKDLCEYADVVFTMLQTGDQVGSCCVGERGIFSHIKKDTLFIDCSSIDVEASKALHKEAQKHNITMLDAPVSGGVGAATIGTLTFMVGGEQAAFKRAEPVLSSMGKKIIFAGQAGSGAAAKICNNMILAISMIGVSEAFVLAEKLGLSAQKLFEICSSASGQCWSLTSYCPWPGVMPNVPSSNEYKAGFTAKMMLKDLNLSQAAAQFGNTTTPLGKHATEMYQAFVDDGNAEMDFSGIIQELRK